MPNLQNLTKCRSRNNIMLQNDLQNDLGQVPAFCNIELRSAN